MQKLLLFAMLLFVLNIAFAETEEERITREETERITRETTERIAAETTERLTREATERAINETREGIASQIRNETEELIRNETAERVREATESEVENQTREAREDIRIGVENQTRAAREEIDRELRVRNRIDAETDRRLKMNASDRIKEKLERKCDGIVDANERIFCEREKTTYLTIEKVRERHRLSEECRRLTGSERSACQERVNRHFRDVIQERFKEFKREELSGGETARAIINSVHERVSEARLNDEKSQAKRNLIERIDGLIASAGKKADLLERALNKAKEKGYDTARLEFLLEEYKIAMDKAKIFYDDEQYRDTLAALNDAKNIFKQFRFAFADLIK
ncbi:hypothetical protein J4450_01985 [Candidatus Micrarchaeota archaeon]|nr:hypothetical protein [Candidatus Micrarchaeota archaeon]